MQFVIHNGFDYRYVMAINSLIALTGLGLAIYGVFFRNKGK